METIEKRNIKALRMKLKCAQITISEHLYNDLINSAILFNESDYRAFIESQLMTNSNVNIDFIVHYEHENSEYNNTEFDYAMSEFIARNYTTSECCDIAGQLNKDFNDTKKRDIYRYYKYRQEIYR